MRRNLLHIPWVFMLFFIAPAIILSQTGDCPSIVKTAIDTVKDACAAISRNQACYGNVHLDATSRESEKPLAFTKPGDLADLANVQRLKLSPMDAQNNIWGVALMKVQADIPDTLPGQNVTFILFGDVQIQNAVTDTTAPISITLTTTKSVGLLAKPASGEKPLIALQKGTKLIADGRLQDNSWLHVQLTDGSIAGWIFATFAKIDSDLNGLTVTDPSVLNPHHPMQAFYFQSGLHDRPCNQAPDSGILVQTPQGKGKINLLADEVEVQLGSTAYLQAQPNGNLIITVIEGSARVTVGSRTITVPSGTRLQIPLDNDLKPNGPLGKLESYDVATLKTLPIGLLQRRIAIATGLVAKQVDKLNQDSTSTSTAPGGSSAASNVNPKSAGCSVKGDTPTSVSFTNNSQRTISIIWIGYDCKEVLYSKLQPGQSYKQETFATHPWIVRDSQSNDLVAGPFVSKDGSPFSVTISQ
jgi:hypothetical protein